MDWFQALHPDAFVNRGRDSHLLSMFMKDRGVSSSIVLEGMVFGYGCKSVAIFLNSADDWLLSDALKQEAELAIFLSAETPPPFFYDYCDLTGSGIPSHQIEAARAKAQAELEVWVNEALDAPAKSPNHPASLKAIIKVREDKEQ